MPDTPGHPTTPQVQSMSFPQAPLTAPCAWLAAQASVALACPTDVAVELDQAQRQGTGKNYTLPPGGYGKTQQGTPSTPPIVPLTHHEDGLSQLHPSPPCRCSAHAPPHAIAMGSHRLDSHLCKSAEAGFYLHLIKPFALDSLASALRRLATAANAQRAKRQSFTRNVSPHLFPLINTQLLSFITEQAAKLVPDDIAALSIRLPDLRQRFSELDALDYPGLAEQYAFLVALIEDCGEHLACDLPDDCLREAAFTLLYLEARGDLLPESLPGIGYVDDQAIVQLVL